METVGGIITLVSTQLNDQRTNMEFMRWPRATLLEYLNLALAAVGTFRKDAFIENVTIPLVPGSRQATKYDEILEVVSNSDGRAIHKADTSLLKAFSAYNYCAPKVNFKNGKAVYSAKSAGVDIADPKVFYVSPPLPQGLSATVIATVSKGIPTHTLADWNKPVSINSKYIPNLLDYMQARAYEVDLESYAAQTQSQKFYKQFYEALGISYKMDAAFRSGYYKGQVGTGDPRATA